MVQADGVAVLEREEEDQRVAAEHMARRMGFLGYGVSDGVLAALSDEDGVVPHRVLVGIQGPSIDERGFPFALVAEKTHVSRERVPSYWQSTKGAAVEISTASAVVWVLAQLALGIGYAEREG